MKTIIAICVIFNNFGYISSESVSPMIHETFPENIEYCQNVYMSGQNPLNETCDFDQVERSLEIDFDTYYNNF